MDYMCPSGLNQTLWESCLRNASKSKEWAETELKKYPDFQTNPDFTDIARNQILHFTNTPVEKIAQEEYDFIIMMAKHGTAFRGMTDQCRIDISK